MNDKSRRRTRNSKLSAYHATIASHERGFGSRKALTPLRNMRWSSNDNTSSGFASQLFMTLGSIMFCEVFLCRAIVQLTTVW